MNNSISCPFCTLDPSRILAANDLAVAVCDAYPVSPGHTLMVPKRHVASFFETTGTITSRQIGADPNVPGFLLTLSGRGIIGPADRDLWPARQYLAEHRREWRL